MVEQSPRSIPDQEPQHLRSLGRLRYEIDRAFESSLFLQAPGETTVTPNGGAITSVDPGSGTTASSITGKTEVRNRSCFRINSFFLQAPGETTITPNGGAITPVDLGSGTTASSITG